MTGALQSVANAILAGLRRIGEVLGWLVSLPSAGLEWLGELRVELWIVEGAEPSSSLPLSVLLAASGADRNCWLRRAVRRLLSRCSLGPILDLEHCQGDPSVAPGSAMMLAEVFESQMKYVRPHCLFVPMWLFGEVDLPRDEQANRRVKARPPHHPAARAAVRGHARSGPIARLLLQHARSLRQQHLRRVCRRGILWTPPRGVSLLRPAPGKTRGEPDRRRAYFLSRAHPHLWEMGIRDGNRDYLKVVPVSPGISSPSSICKRRATRKPASAGRGRCCATASCKSSENGRSG